MGILTLISKFRAYCFAAGFVGLLWLSWISFYSYGTPHSPFGLASRPALGGTANSEQRIQVIAVWSGKGSGGGYLRNFLYTMHNNEDFMDLLFVNLDTGEGCVENELFETFSNIQMVCLGIHDYWSYHADALCKGWNCTDEQYLMVLNELERRSNDNDGTNVRFKPFWGLIFERYFISNKVSYWAWTDVDIFYGPMKEFFLPLVESRKYDVITIDNGATDLSNIYCRGQFTAFQRSAKMQLLWLKTPHLRSIDAYMTEFPQVGGMDESYWSNVFLYDLPTNWISIAQGQGGDEAIKIAPSERKFVFSRRTILEVPLSLERADISSLFQSTEFFSQMNHDPAVGHTRREIEVTTDCSIPWMDSAYHLCVNLNYSAVASKVGFIAREEGKIYQYARPKNIFDVILPKAFSHFLMSKREGWMRYPQIPLTDDQIFEVSKDNISIWQKHTLDDISWDSVELVPS